MENTDELYKMLTKEERARFDMVSFDLQAGVQNLQEGRSYFGKEMADELTFSLIKFLYERRNR